MSTNATTPSKKPSSTGATPRTKANGSPDKGKGKAKTEESMDEDDGDDDEDDEDEDEDDDELDVDEEEDQELDPSAILPTTGRRTRGIKVDYTSPEALQKAGLKPETPDEDAEDSYHHEEMEE